MNAGLYAYYPSRVFERTLNLTLTRPGTLGVLAQASMIGTYATTGSLSATGLEITCASSVNTGISTGSGSGYVQFRYLGNSFLHSISGGEPLSLVGRIEVENERIYYEKIGSQLGWVVTWDSILFKVNGSTVSTVAAGVFGAGLEAPLREVHGRPPFGVSGPRCGISATVNPAPALGLPAQQCSAVAAVVTELTASGTALWTFGEPLLVNLDILSGVPVACTGVSATLPTFTCPDIETLADEAYMRWSDGTTYEGEITCAECSNGPAVIPAKYDHFLRTIEYTTRGSEISMLPDLAKSVRRMGESADFRELVYRGGLPKTERRFASTCYDFEAGTTIDSDETVEEVHPSRSLILSNVGEAVHAIEDPFADETFAPYSASGFDYLATRSCFVLTQAGACPAVGEGEPAGTIIDCRVAEDSSVGQTVTSEFPYTVEDDGDNPDILAELIHDEKLARYMAVAAPHQCFFTWFPVNNEESESAVPVQSQWELMGDPVSNLYFINGRSQWGYQVALPGPEQTQRRNSLQSHPLSDSVLVTVNEAYWGIPTTHWGISRFDPIEWDPLSSYTYDSDSEDLWSATDCTITHGGDIEVQPDPGEANVAIQLALGTWGQEPFMYPHICNRVTLTWDVTNVAELKAFIVGASGAKWEIPVTNGVTTLFPDDAITRTYAASYAIDHGGMFLIDLGYDTRGEGASFASMANEERNLSFELTPGVNGAHLRIEIEVVDPNDPVNLDYPEIHAAATNPVVFHENGHSTVCLWENGPAIRFGNWSWFADFANILRSVPVVLPPGHRSLGGWKSSALDMLCFMKAVAEGVDRSTNLITDLAATYTSREGQTYALADAHTISFLTQEQPSGSIIGILVNTYRELPICPLMPRRERDGVYAESGDYVQEAWVLAQEPRRYAAAGGELHIDDGGGNVTASWTLPSPWSGTTHNEAVDNDEPYYDVLIGTTKIGEARLWHGYLAQFAVDESAGKGAGLSHDVSPSNTHYVAYIDSGTGINLGVSPNTLPLAFNYQAVPDITDVEALDIKWIDSARGVRIWYVDPTGLHWIQSTDEGANWTVPTTITSSGSPSRVAAVVGKSGTHFIYWIDGATIKGRQYDAAGTALTAEFTAVASGVDAADLDAQERTLAGGRHQIILLYMESGALKLATSDDGETFV